MVLRYCLSNFELQLVKKWGRFQFLYYLSSFAFWPLLTVLRAYIWICVPGSLLERLPGTLRVRAGSSFLLLLWGLAGGSFHRHGWSCVWVLTGVRHAVMRITTALLGGCVSWLCWGGGTGGTFMLARQALWSWSPKVFYIAYNLAFHIRSNWIFHVV